MNKLEKRKNFSKYTLPNIQNLHAYLSTDNG